MQEALIQEQMAQQAAYQNAVSQVEQRGGFNPDRAIQQADSTRSYQEGQALGNEVAGARALGYRAGDTAPLQAMNATRGAYNLQAAQQDQGLRQAANQALLSARAVDLPNATGAAIGALGENYRTDLGLQQPVGGMLGALAPYLSLSQGQQAQAYNPYGSPYYTDQVVMGDPGYGQSPIPGGANASFQIPLPGQAPVKRPLQASAENFQLAQQSEMQAQPSAYGPLSGAAPKAPVPGDSTPATGGFGGYRRPRFSLPQPVFDL